MEKLIDPAKLKASRKDLKFSGDLAIFTEYLTNIKNSICFHCITVPDPPNSSKQTTIITINPETQNSALLEQDSAEPSITRKT